MNGDQRGVMLAASGGAIITVSVYFVFNTAKKNAWKLSMRFTD